MIKFEHAEVVGWEPAIRGMRNPMNSWDKSDSGVWVDTNSITGKRTLDFYLGENDLNLMKKLRKAGTDHRKYLRMINVYVDITAPLYWWKEFDTYKVGTVANSCSTMHKLADKEFTLDDFSIEHLIGKGCIPDHAEQNPYDVFNLTIDSLNYCRDVFLETKDKIWWEQMIQMLPTSYNQKRTVMINYETLNNIYKSRKNHKLDEWRIGFMNFIKSLPYAQELIIGEMGEAEDK